MSKFKRLVTTGFLVGALALVIGPSQALADDDDGDGLVGTWRSTVGGPAGPFSDLMVFNKDRTLATRNSLKSDTVGRGVWKEIGDEDGTFAATFEVFTDVLVDDPPDSEFAQFAHRAQVRVTIQLDQDTMHGTSTVDFFTVDGDSHLFGPFPGIPVEATRMKVIPEEGVILDDGDDDDDDDD